LGPAAGTILLAPDQSELANLGWQPVAFLDVNNQKRSSASVATVAILARSRDRGGGIWQLGPHLETAPHVTSPFAFGVSCAATPLPVNDLARRFSHS
jgi:hypothetical protein